DLIYLEALRPHPNYTGENRIGGRLPMHVGGAGLTLLAFSPDEVIEDYLSRPLRAYTLRTVVDPDEMRALLAEIRRRRFASTTGLLTPRAGSVAAPVISPDGDVVAVVGLVVLLDRGNPDEYVELVRGTAARASHALLDRPAPMSPGARDFHLRHAAPA